MNLYCFIWLIIPAGVLMQTFSDEPTDVVSLEGQRVTFTCTVSGVDPGTSLAWRKDSETIVTLDEHISVDFEDRVELSSLGTYNLVFRYVTANDTGTYDCGYLQPNGTYVWSQAALLTIIQFTEHPKNASIFEYDELTLSCTIENKLPGQLTFWLKDPSEILAIDDHVLLGSEDNRTSAYIIDGQYKLHFSYLRLNDTGTYRCGVLANGDRYYPSNGAEVVVIEMPEFVTQPVDTHVFENQPAILTCAVNTSMQNFTLAWQKNSEIVTVSTRDNMRVSGNHESGEYNLEFIYTTVDDAGVYRCGVDTGNDGVYYWSRAAVLSVDEKLTTSSEHSTERSTTPTHDTTTTDKPLTTKVTTSSTTPMHDATTTDKPLTTKVTPSSSTRLNTESSKTSRSGDSTRQPITTMNAIDSTSQFTQSSNTSVPTAAKVKTGDNLFLAILLSIVFGVLLLLGIAAVIAVIVVSVRRNRRQKHHEEYSPQERIIDEWKLRSPNSSSNPDLEKAIAMKTGITNIVAFEDEEDFDSANWSNDGDSEGSGHITTDSSRNVEDIYAKPDKSFKSKEGLTTNNLEKTDLNHKPQIDATPDEPVAINARSLLRNYNHDIYDIIEEEKVSPAKNATSNTPQPENDAPTNNVDKILPLRESVMVNANTGTILLDDFQMEEESTSNKHELGSSRAESQTRL